MELYKKQFTESINDNANELASEIQQEIQKIFPKSYVYAGLQTKLGASIEIWFTLGKDKSEYSMGIMRNDPAWMVLHVFGKPDDSIGKDGSINGLLSLESSTAGSFVTKPTDPYRAYGRYKVPFRKVTGDGKKILEGIKRYMTNFKKQLQDNRNLLTDEHLELIGDKF